MKCKSCEKEFDIDSWEKGKTYKGIDRHHNPPEEITKFLKEEWGGEIINLCRECHKELHKEITNILKKYSHKNYDSDDWLMKYSTMKKIKEAKKEIIQFTKKWVKR